MKHTKATSLLLAAGLAASLAACTSGASSSPNDATSAAASAEAQQAGAGLDLIFTNQPDPVFPTSAWRQQLIEVEATEALGTPTTAFFFPPGWNGTGGHPFKECGAEGLPIPNTAQLDNPDEIVQDPYGGGYNLNQGGLVKPQADPNGVYTPASSSGTYVACLNSGGGLRAAYWEGDVFAETGAAIWDTTAGMIKDIGPSQLPVCVLKTSTRNDGLHLGTVTNGIYHAVKYYHCDPAAAAAAYHVPWTIPARSPSGKVVLMDYASSNPLVLHCTVQDGKIWGAGKEHKVQVAESTCAYPGDLSLTFAPWGIVKVEH